MTSINERQYQLPFCQVLAAEGETILYVSSHGPLEKGKDIITRTAGGEIRAYQLKMGNIGVSEWRDICGEISELVELVVELPSIGTASDFSPFLVTNGELTDPVRERVRAANLTWQSRGLQRKLTVIEKGELLDRFQKSHGAYLPNELDDFRAFLELILRDGTFTANKSAAATLFEQLIPTKDKLSNLEIQRAAASILLLTAYIGGAAERANNHYAIFEYWVLAASYIAQLNERHCSSEETWKTSFSLCVTAADRAVGSLIEEVESAPHFVSGSPLVDGHTYSARVAVLTGLFAAYSLSHRIRRTCFPQADFIYTFLRRNLKYAMMWGESAVPYLMAVALEAEQRCRSDIAEGLVIQLIREITTHNSLEATSRGLPNVYYSPEQAIKFNNGLDFLNDETFIGHTYAVHALLEFLARRWRRQALASLWHSVTRLALSSFVPATRGEWCRWKAQDGALEIKFAGEPQSWFALCQESEQLTYEDLPAVLQNNPDFAVYFMLVFPHRFCRKIVKLVEDSLREPAEGAPPLRSGRTKRLKS